MHNILSFDSFLDSLLILIPRASSWQAGWPGGKSGVLGVKTSLSPGRHVS